jgi:sugar lactone lactonase YvrE
MVAIHPASKIARLALAGLAGLVIGGIAQAATTGTGASVTFTATATSGSQPFSYRWQKNGIDIPGAISNTYLIPWAQVTINGAPSSTDTYSAVISNSAGSATATTTLTVNATPVNDNFANASSIPGAAAILRGTNVAATKEPSEPNHAGNSGGASVWWKWTAPQSGTFTVDTVGSSFDTVLGVYTGSSLAALLPAASDDNSGGNGTSYVSFQAVSGTTYYVAVDGKNGATGAILLQLTNQSEFLPAFPMTTFAGTAGLQGTTDATGAAARFHNPSGIAVDSAGTFYVADQLNHTIRKITSAGVVTTLAGSAGSTGTADGTGTAAKFNNPAGVAVDSAGNVYVADSGNHTIRFITSGGVVTTLAGSGGLSGFNDGLGTVARFNSPSGIAVDANGSLYVADSANHTIRLITPGGAVSTVAGFALVSGNADGTGTAARFNNPTGIAVDAASNLYVADNGNHTLRRIAPGGVVSTPAGNPGTSGSADGTGTSAGFKNPAGVAVDAAGNVFVADFGNHTIRFVTTAGSVSTIAGLAGSLGTTNGTGSAAKFNNPRGLVLDSSGNLFIADNGNHAIRKGSRTQAGPVITNPAKILTGTGVVGGSVTLGATGTSDPGATLQWYFNTINSAGLIAGATKETYTLNDLQPFQAGTYYLVATNPSVGSPVTTSVTLTVAPIPSTVAGYTADFDGDGRADFLWYNNSTGDRYFWLMNGGTVNNSIFLNTILGWTMTPADFNHDGKADLLLSNTATGDRYIWLMNGSGSVVGNFFLGTIPPVWTATIGDFDGDGNADILWSNSGNGDRYIWLMNGGTVSNNIFLGTISTLWNATVGDFNGDGKADILWSNNYTGDRYIWLMNAGAITSGTFIGTVPVEWIPSTGDFNADGMSDIFWSNSSTGDCYLWLMNGSAATFSIFLGTIPTQWTVALGDLNGDHKADLIWSNSATGDRYLWFMDGGTVTSNVYLGNVPVQWLMGY